MSDQQREIQISNPSFWTNVLKVCSPRIQVLGDASGKKSFCGQINLGNTTTFIHVPLPLKIHYYRILLILRSSSTWLEGDSVT